MRLSRAQWEDNYAAGTLKLALIGMSNIGKSYSGTRLAASRDFALIEVDKLIWEELGESDMAAFAAWQGQPYTEGYAEREAKSLAMESRATEAALATAARNPLLDTTGSVIYTDARIRAEIKASCFTVYIEAAPEHLERLQQLYFASPKPLAWHGHYTRHPGLSDDESLLASYPGLLTSRHRDYSAMADHTVSSRDILTDSAERLFDLVKPAR